jgi:hypothetical protein
MSARHEVNHLLGQWLELTRAEAGAIQAAAWPNVGAIQSSKAALRESLTRALDRWNLENGRATIPPNHPFRAQVNRLLSLETRNAEIVAAQMRRVQHEQQRNAEDLRNLLRLQRSYGRPSGKNWETFS